jgi:hypothetical protein
MPTISLFFGFVIQMYGAITRRRTFMPSIKVMKS